MLYCRDDYKVSKLQGKDIKHTASRSYSSNTFIVSKLRFLIQSNGISQKLLSFSQNDNFLLLVFTKRCYVCEKWGATKMRHSVEIAVKNRIIDHGRGWCFTPMHFSDLGNDPSIRKALSLLQKQNFI